MSEKTLAEQFDGPRLHAPEPVIGLLEHGDRHIADLRAKLAQAEERVRRAYNEGVCAQLRCMPGHTPVNPYDRALGYTPAAPLVASAEAVNRFVWVCPRVGYETTSIRAVDEAQAREIARVLSEARMPWRTNVLST